MRDQSTTDLWIWKDRNAQFSLLFQFLGIATPNDFTVNLSICDLEENCVSVPYAAPDQLNFLDLSRVVPEVPEAFRKGGWVRVKFSPTPFGALLQATGVAVQQIGGQAATPLHAALPAQRSYNFSLPSRSPASE